MPPKNPERSPTFYSCQPGTTEVVDTACVRGCVDEVLGGGKLDEREIVTIRPTNSPPNAKSENGVVAVAVQDDVTARVHCFSLPSGTGSDPLVSPVANSISASAQDSGEPLQVIEIEADYAGEDENNGGSDDAKEDKNTEGSGVVKQAVADDEATDRVAIEEFLDGRGWQEVLPYINFFHPENPDD